ncbi:MAG: type II secretion system F family protein [Candidatus Pacebacteria bacterium]|nr:type II secretion system F family protein [Candidatus Paceibacterota bacterium]MCD8528183.1 type II secretion system F family protein [Candidatus Paceibacterota bacterium]MCD8563455.1 type II secretion system F family protein [Candidatus Paceibacterota bacterium]
MLFKYEVIDQSGQKRTGEIDALGPDLATSALQSRGFIVIKISEVGEGSLLKKNIPFFDGVKMKDIVIMSRQLSALFDAQVSAVKAFSLMAESMGNPTLRRTLQQVTQDIQGGISISAAMRKSPAVFSDFYVNMVNAGEESGKLTETFIYLADYLERQYELSSKTQNALIYPAFVILTFIVVMTLMLVLVIPNLSAIILEAGQQIPFYTQVVISVSDFFVNYGFIVLILAIIGGFFVWRMSQSESGQYRLDMLKVRVPYIGDLFSKLYLSRIADNMNTMLSAGIPVVRSLEITGNVVGNKVYQAVMHDALEDVKAGTAISDSMKKHPEIPAIMVQMIQVGEETGSLGSILETLARFYKREVDGAVDTLIGLIEPILIVFLGLGVGFLLTSILVPIYNIASSL